jgi:hypothetical protein
VRVAWALDVHRELLGHEVERIVSRAQAAAA